MQPIILSSIMTSTLYLLHCCNKGKFKPKPHAYAIFFLGSLAITYFVDYIWKVN